MTTIDELFGIKTKSSQEKSKEVTETKKPKSNSVTLTQWLNSINYEKNYILDNNNQKDYPQFVINRCLYKHRDLIYYIDALNNINISNRMHYDFLFEAVPSKKRWLPFNNKKQENIDDIELVKKYYNVNNKRALEYYNILDESDINYLKKYFEKGGLEDKKLKSKL